MSLKYFNAYNLFPSLLPTIKKRAISICELEHGQVADKQADDRRQTTRIHKNFSTTQESVKRDKDKKRNKKNMNLKINIEYIESVSIKMV